MRGINQLFNLIFFKMKNFLKRIWLFLAALWTGVDKLVHKAAPVAVEVVNVIKTINDSFIGDVVETIIAKVIPGPADDVIIARLRAKLREILPKVILQLNLAQSIADIQDPNEQLKAVINAINMSTDETKNAYYHTLCTMILNSLADGKLTWSESVQIAEYYYMNIYKNRD